MRILLLLGCCACGARTDIGSRRTDAGAPPVTEDASLDAPMVLDARPDVPSDAPPVQCTQGVLTEFGTAECSGDKADWFATPYTPPADITVDRVEAHMQQGNVALLASAGGAPGAPLFVGSVGSSSMPTWLGTTVSPPVFLQAGTLYYIGFQGDCSFAGGGPEPVEYMASSINGPWHVQGTDNWTARLIGMCP
jgi:hypothetical protein